MKPISKFFYYVAWMGILGAIAIIILVTYWFVAPYDVLTFNDGNNVLLTSTIKSGGYVQVKQNYCKHMNIVATTSCTFIDGIVYQIPTYDSNREVGCGERIEYIYVPKALPQGSFKLRCVYSYRVNPLRTIKYEFETPFFPITKE